MNYKRFIFAAGLFILLSFPNCYKISAQESGKLDAVFIAKEYYNSIVKILLFDSIAEKEVPGSGYIGRGSGFIVTEDGVVFTNRHVIDFCMEYMQYKYFSPSDKKYYTEINNYYSSCLSDPEYLSISYVRRATPIIQVYTDKNQNNYKLYLAKLVSIDSENFDGAVLQIVSDMKGNPVTEKFHPLPIGNSDQTNQGEDLCLFGYPAQYDDANFDLMLRDQSTLTFGKHSGFDFVFNPEYGYIKTDASVNSGNSGGPVFNPTNKIIGIATATSEKTNIGLVGGINAMYHVVNVPNNYLDTYQKIDILKAGIGINPDRLRKGRNCRLITDLTAVGLTEPQKKVAKNTAFLYTKQRVPTVKEIERSNERKKAERKFLGSKFYFRISYTPSNRNKYFIDATADSTSGIIFNNNGAKVQLNVKTRSSKDFEFGRQFTLARFSNKSKLSLEYSFSFGIEDADWTNSNIYSDTTENTISYRDNAFSTKFGQRLGVCYSNLIFKKYPLDVYYKFSGIMEDCNELGYYDNIYVNNVQYNDGPELRYESYPLLHSIGITFRKNAFFIGLEYTKGKGRATYELPNIEKVGQYYNGTEYVNTYAIESYKSTSEIKYKNLKVTVGIMFGGGSKWKKIAIDKFNKG